MEKFDDVTLRLVRRLKSANSRNSSAPSTSGATPGPSLVERNPMAAAAGDPPPPPREEEVSGGGGSGAGPLALVPAAAAAADEVDAPKRQGAKQLFLPHLNLENRFLVSSQDAAHYGGWLLKRGSHMKVWRKRWFTVESDCIIYRKNPQDFEIRGSIPLCCVRNIFRTDNVKSKSKYDNACICIKTDWRTYVVVAETALEARQWNFYLFRVWRQCVAKSRQAVHKIENISTSELIEETQLNAVGGAGTAEDAAEANENDLPSKSETFADQMKQAEQTRSAIVRRLWKVACRVIILQKSVAFAKDVAEIYQKQASVVSQQRSDDAQTQRRAQETIRLLKRTVRKVNGLHDREAERSASLEEKIAALEAELARANESIVQKEEDMDTKDKENKQLEMDVLNHQKEVENYYEKLTKQHHILTNRPWAGTAKTNKAQKKLAAAAKTAAK